MESIRILRFGINLTSL